MELKLEIADVQNLSILLRNIPEDLFPNRSSVIKLIDDQIRDNTCIRFPTSIEEIDLHIMSFIPDMEWRYVLLVNKSTLSLLNKDYLWRPKIESKFGYDFGLSLGHSYMNFYYRLSLTKKDFFYTAVDYSIIPLVKFIVPLASEDEQCYYLTRVINEKNMDVIIEIFKRDDSHYFDEILKDLSLPDDFFYPIFDTISSLNEDNFIQRADCIISYWNNWKFGDNIDTRIKSLFIKYPILKSVILSTAIDISTLKKWTREIIRNLDTKEILALCTGNFGICDKELASLFKIYRKRDVEGARKLLEYILCNDNDNDNDFLDIMILKSLGNVGKIKYVRKIIDNRFVASHEEATRDIAIIVGLMKQSKIHRLASLAKEKNMVLFFYKLLKDNPKVIDYVSAGFTPRDQWSIMVDTIKSENVIAGHIIFSDEWISILDENDINLIFNRIKKLSNYHILILRHCFEANIRLSLQTMINVSLAIDTKDTVICNLLVRYLTHNLDRYDIDSFFEFFERIAPKLRYVKWILKNNCFFQIFPLLFKNMCPVMINRSLLYILQKINTLSNNRVKDIWQTLFFLDFTILHSFTSDLLAKNIIDNYKDISNDSYVFCSIISNLRPKMRYIKWIFDKGFDYYSLIRYLAKNMKEYLLLRCNRLARSRGVLEDFYMCLNADTLKIIFDKSTEEELYELLPDRIKPFSSREKLLIACYKEFYILDE